LTLRYHQTENSSKALISRYRRGVGMSVSASKTHSLTRLQPRGREVVVKLLLGRNDANPDSSSESGRTPLSWAIGNDREGIVKPPYCCDGKMLTKCIMESVHFSDKKVAQVDERVYPGLSYNSVT